MSLWKLLFIALLQPGIIRCAVKTWAANTNYNNANNWDLKRIPCGNDRVIFPENDNVSVYMPETAVLRELVLPSTGLLIFPIDSSLVVGGDVSGHPCPGQDIKFTGGQRQDRWFDPYNWNITSEFAVNLGEDKDLLPVPHSDQVPCKNDHVVFPKDASFKLHFDGSPLKVQSLSINGLVYTSEEFSSFLTSHTGKCSFVNPPEVEIRRQTCTNASGCPCGNDQSETMSKICSVMAPKCPKLQCLDPIQITGHCCRVCGSSLSLEYKEGFSLNVLGRLINSYLRKYEYRSVQGYTSRTLDDKIQSVFVDSGIEKGFAHELAKDVEAYLKQDIADQQIYKLTGTDLKSTIKWLASREVVTHSPYSGESGGTSAGTSVGIVLAVLISISLAVAFYLFYRKRTIPGFRFARFDSDGSKIEMELGTTPHDMLDPIAASSSSSRGAKDGSTGFDNPMYEKSKFSLTNPSYKVLKDEEKKSTDYRENPAYMVLDNGDE